MRKSIKILYLIIFVHFIISGVAAYAWTWNNTNCDWGNLQWPSTATINGIPIDTYGQMFIEGVTNNFPNPPPGIIAEIGFGPWGTDPTVNHHWVWRTAIFHLIAYTNYEYLGKLDIPYTGTFSYTYRYSRDGGATWTLADLDGTQNGIAVNQFGTATVLVPSSAPSVPIPSAVLLLLLD